MDLLLDSVPFGYRFARAAWLLVRLRALSTPHPPSWTLHFQLHRGSCGAQNADIVVNAARFAVSQHQIGANSQRVGANFVAKRLPPTVTCLLVDERAVELSEELDSARRHDAAEGVAEGVGELSKRNQLDGLRVERGTGGKRRANEGTRACRWSSFCRSTRCCRDRTRASYSIKPRQCRYVSIPFRTDRSLTSRLDSPTERYRRCHASGSRRLRAGGDDWAGLRSPCDAPTHRWTTFRSAGSSFDSAWRYSDLAFECCNQRKSASKHAGRSIRAANNTRVSFHIEELLVAKHGIGASLLRLLTDLTTKLHSMSEMGGEKRR